MNYNQRTSPRRACDVCSVGRGAQRANESHATVRQDLTSPSLAMAYVPSQEWSEPYPLAQGLENGTIFADLNMPFYGSRFRCGAGCQNESQRRGQYNG